MERLGIVWIDRCAAGPQDRRASRSARCELLGREVLDDVEHRHDVGGAVADRDGRARRRGAARPGPPPRCAASVRRARSTAASAYSTPIGPRRSGLERGDQHLPPPAAEIDENRPGREHRLLAA